MSKAIDFTKPITDEERQYLHSRSDYYAIEENDRVHGKGKFAKDYDPGFVPDHTVGAAPIEPGSAADNPPQFVGQRPHGVDRGVWGGTAGKTEAEALAGNSGEPHHTQVEAPVAEEHEVEEVAVQDLTDAQLAEQLTIRKLDTTGDHDALVARLNEALEKE